MKLAPLAGCVLVLILAAPALADVDVEVSFGFGGQAVSSALTPLRVRVKSRETSPLTVRVEANYRSGRSADERWSTVDTVSGLGEKVFTFYGRGIRRSSPKVTISFDRKVTVTQVGGRRFRSTSAVEIELADPPGSDTDSPAYIQIVAAGPQASLLPSVRYAIRVMPIDEADLPDVWHAYEGLDVVLLRNPAEDAPLEPAVQEALLDWVESGGRLVVSATRRPDLIADTSLGKALPARIGPPVEGGADYEKLASVLSGRRRRNNPVEGGPLLTLSPEAGATFRTVTNLGPRETVLWAEARRGLGSIVVLAFDTARLARAQDKEAEALFGLLLNPNSSADPIEGLHGLFDDFLDYELLSPPQNYPAGIQRLLRTGALQRPPMFLLSLFMILYVLAIGPFDYVFLKRRNKLSWSAASLILIALAFSATAWFVSFYLFAGSTRINRLTLADVAPAADGSGMDRVRISDMAGHYEPRGGTVALEPDGWDTAVYGPLAEPENYMQWGSSLPGDLFETAPVRAGASASRFRIPFRSVRSSRATLMRAEAFPLDVSYERGQAITVRSDLPYDLRDSHLVTWESGELVIVPVGAVPAGATRKIAFDRMGTRKFITGTTLRDANAWTPDLLEHPDDSLPRLGRTIMGLTLSGCFRDHFPDQVGPTAERILCQLAIDRSAAVRRGAPLFLAWTSARDPFGLGAESDEGFTITVIRRWIEP